MIIILVTAAITSACEVLGQASFQLRNLNSSYGVNAPVFDAEGLPLAGRNYLAELWGSATPDALLPLIDLVALGLGGYGESPLFYANGSDPTLALPEPPAPLIGLQSFNLRAVIPEPSSALLLLLGLPLLLLRRLRYWK